MTTKSAGTETRTTYIRKSADGSFEYGWSYPNRNFRKASSFEPVGSASTVREAETLREDLAATPPRKRQITGRSALRVDDVSRKY